MSVLRAPIKTLIVVVGTRHAASLWEVLYDLVIDCIGGCIGGLVAVFLVCVLLWLLERKYLSVWRFFGLDSQGQVEIYISGHEDDATVTKRVMTYEEYEAVVKLVDALRQLPDIRVVRIITRVTGQELRHPKPVIKISPLEPLSEALPGALILIGGPLRNQVTQFYQEREVSHPPLIKFDGGSYLVLKDGEYQKRDDVVASIERRTVGGQVVITVFGLGESDTRSAVQHLIDNWRALDKRRPNQDIGVLLFADGGDETL